MNEDLRKPQPPNEEVDLGQLFNAIGRLFERFFRFIGRIFKGLFGVILLFLFFIQKHFVKFAVVVVIGFIIGAILDAKKEPKYISTMVIEPNFNSVQQLYNNIAFYNELAKAEDFLSLSEALSITETEALAIRKFKVESYSDENQKIVLFDKFVRSLDTTTQKAIDMKSYLENFNSYDARFHTISVIASVNTVAKKIQPAIISSISNNSYFNLQKDISDSNIKLQDSLYNKQITEIDSLQLLYKRVMLKEAERSLQGTNISLGENGRQDNKELSLINKMEDLQLGLVELNKERGNKSSILNVISDFPRKGVRDKGILKSYKFLIPSALLIVTVLLILLLSLNKYLKNYSRNNIT
ncbi:hypothetical protein LX77_01908 [Gelidibacter algens]|uniref:Subunit length determinant protein n=1 Tax=Gelidibacter algens TaxID=49280 RepID=A0A1A7QZL3_9FLAO|nr:hypothetical protein [Gelidibacter algens]OBX23967.1 hypothetical protein A9996_15435 [Gelidibacter algens]RAJ24356.1 hypothetical protein LX77_01908 [Gelidibacter algens]